jgi:pyruvate carboxylase
MAKELERMGAHILGIKDMAGLCKPYAAHKLVKALRGEVGIPIHFHTHDTSGINAASILGASDAGVDIADAAAAAMSGLTSQPNLNSLVEALRNTPRDTGLDIDAWNECSRYWEGVRRLYYPFESHMRSGTAEVYKHEMPGGQVTNLQEQAKGLGLGERWPEVARMYATVNGLFGDIIKVTPTSKVVGDMALFMVSNNLTADDLLDEHRHLSFPQSVVDLFEGKLGQPYGGFPAKLQKVILRGKKPMTKRPGEMLPPTKFSAVKTEVESKVKHTISETDLLSYLMYPGVMVDFDAHRRQYSDVSVVPTAAFFYGMKPGQEITIEIEAGKTLIVKFITIGEANDEGVREVFFELNGQPRNARVLDTSLKPTGPLRPKADPDNPGHVASPMPGKVGALPISVGQEVKKGEKLLSIEAMKMETAVYAPVSGRVKELHVRVGSSIESRDLLVTIEPAKA